MLRFSSLGSGSEGNALLIQSESQLIMVDCGFGVRALEAKLAERMINPQSITALLITHEHADHIAGAASVAAKYQIPVYASYGTLAAHPKIKTRGLPHIALDSNAQFEIGGIKVCAYTVPHDARQPIQFTFTVGTSKLGILTDVGHITPHIEQQLADCHALFLEFNHDESLLAQNTRYPASLIARIKGDSGHLSNQQSIALLQKLQSTTLNTIVAAHLSQENNRTEWVAALLQAHTTIQNQIIACQAKGHDWIHVNSDSR